MLPANGKVEKNQKRKVEKWCSLHNSTSHSNQESFEQKNGSKCKDSSTVDSRNSEEHETYVVDSTTVGCKSCCCSNGKIAKKSNEESEVKYSPPSGIGSSSAYCHPPLSHQADRFQMLVDSESSKRFVDPRLIHRVQSRIQDHTETRPPMEIWHSTGHSTGYSTRYGDVCRTVKLSIVLVPGLVRNLFSTALAAQEVVKTIFTKESSIVDLGLFSVQLTRSDTLDHLDLAISKES